MIGVFIVMYDTFVRMYGLFLRMIGVFDVEWVSWDRQ